MKFSKKILPFVLAVCALFGALSLFAACNDEKDPDPLPPGFCTYTVTVTCDDPAVLTKVTVQLLLEEDGSEASKQSPLEEGSVSFTLPATSYTVNIGGAEGYTYPATTLTANRPKATVPLTKEPPVSDRKPVTSFDAPYLGSWVSLALSNGAPAYCIDVERAALYFNDEEMAVETDGGALYFGGFTLAPYAAVSGSLVLSQGEETFYLVPKGGLPRVTPPDSYNGTWVSEDANLSLMGSTLSVNGTDGYFVAYRETESGAAFTAVLGEKFCFLTYDLAARTLLFEEVSAFPFTQTGSGIAGDPIVLTALAGAHEYSMLCTKSEGDSWETGYFFLNTYLSYTPEARETYTLLVTDEHLGFLLQTKEEFDTEDGDILLVWDGGNAERDYASFTLEAGTTYIITVIYNYEGLVRQQLPPYVMHFTIVEGEYTPPASVNVPASLQGTWYNTENAEEVLSVRTKKVVWNNRYVVVTAADGHTMSAIVDGETWNFTQSGTSLTAEKEGERIEFTIVSPEPVTVPNFFKGMWADDADGTLLSVGESGEIPLVWVGRTPEVAALESGALVLVLEGEIWRMSYAGDSLVIAKSGGGERHTFSKLVGIGNFSAPYTGSFAAEGYTLTVTERSFLFNGEELAGSIWSTGSALAFSYGGEIYLFTADGVPTLQALGTGESFPLHAA